MTTLRIYTASRFANYARVRALNEQLRDLGHEVTHDWTVTDEFVDGVPKVSSEADLSIDDRRRYAVDDLRGVRTADLVIFLAEDGDYCGALIEFGAAAALGITAWIISPWRTSIFWSLPNVEVLATEAEVLAKLMQPVALAA